MAFFGFTRVRICVSNSRFYAEFCTQCLGKGWGKGEGASDELRKVSICLVTTVFYFPVEKCKPRIVIREENGVFF